jgi:uncharacterized protein YxeA
MKKGIMALIVILVIVSGLFFQIMFSNTTYDDIYDNNNKITSIADSYAYRNRIGKNKNNETNLSFQLSGMETLWEIKSDNESSILVDYFSQIQKGKLKLVIIQPDDSVQTIFEGSGEEKVEVLLKKGSNRIKVVGKNAKGEINFKILASDDLRVIPRN